MSGPVHLLTLRWDVRRRDFHVPLHGPRVCATLQNQHLMNMRQLVFMSHFSTDSQALASDWSAGGLRYCFIYNTRRLLTALH